MKTNQIMTRPMGQFKVEQRTKDGFFNANALLIQWNSGHLNTKREMSKFLDSVKTNEFMDALKEDLALSQKCDMGEIQIIKETKGKNTKDGRMPDQIWMHPYLFIKFAMWINPRFEVQVIKFVYDQMIKYRNDAGDAYISLSSAVSKIVPSAFMAKAMKKIGEALNWVVFNAHEKMIRNKSGEEEKMRELFELEKKLADLINEGFIIDFESAVNYLRKKYTERNYPAIFK